MNWHKYTIYFKHVSDLIAFDDIDDIIQDIASDNSYNNENIDQEIMIGHNKYDNEKNDVHLGDVWWLFWKRH